MEERLQKFLANQGICSRRKAEQAISEGKVKVNGQVITELGTKINPPKDKIEFEGKLINSNVEKVYILINKPIGYVTTMKDQFSRPTVIDLLQGKLFEENQKDSVILKENLKKYKDNKLPTVLPVGRLDMYTSGALILTNDGDFIYQITHPKHEINKTYQVTVKGEITQEEIEMLRNGIDIGDYITRPAEVRIMKIDPEKKISRIEITIHEGKNRQVRHMCESIGKKVLALHRSKIGDIGVKDLKLGQWRYLSKKEVNLLLSTM